MVSAERLKQMASSITEIEARISELKKEEKMKSKKDGQLLFELILRSLFPKRKNRYGIRADFQDKFECINLTDYKAMSRGDWSRVSSGALIDLNKNSDISKELKDYCFWFVISNKWEEWISY